MNSNTINSKWESEHAQWDSFQEKYVNRTIVPMSDKILKMEIIDGKNGKILQFIGGPTGYESYYIEDLLKTPRSERTSFCICGGTVNSWPRCEVPWSDVLDFLKSQGYSND